MPSSDRDNQRYIEQVKDVIGQQRDGVGDYALMVGAGLHAQASSDPQCGQLKEELGPLMKWPCLLNEVAKLEHLDTLVPEKDPNADLTASWETLVAKFAAKEWTEHQRVGYKSEQQLLSSVKKILSSRAAKINLKSEFFRRVNKGFPRYVINLNFDRSLEQSPSGRFPKSEVARDVRLSRPSHNGRVWYPHGVIARRDSLLLGRLRYGKSLDEVNSAVNRYRCVLESWRKANDPTTRRGERTWSADQISEWMQHVGDAFDCSWVDIFLSQPLIIVGTSLSWSELDLWQALHERQRQFLRWPSAHKPKTFILVEEGSAPKHLRSRPADVQPVYFKSYSDIWNVLLASADCDSANAVVEAIAA